jgi:hypothetical protein
VTRSIPPFSVMVLAVGFALSGGLARAQGCSSWQPASLSSSPNSLATAAWGAGQFFVFASGGASVFASPIGSGWASLGAGPQIPLAQVRWLNGQFVAVGRYEYLQTSPDGLRWSFTGLSPNVGRPPDTTLNDIAWSGSTYVAVGFDPTESSGATGTPIIDVSADMTTWTRVAAPSTSAYREELDGIVWTGTRFVAVGSDNDGGVVLTSDDGRSWSRTHGPGGVSAAWNGHRLVAVGRAIGPSPNTQPAVWWSDNGLTWNYTTIDSSYLLTAVAWDGARFVAAGRIHADPDRAVIVTSPDGVAWEWNQTSVSDSLVAVTSQFGTTVAVGVNGAVLTQTCSAGEPSYVPATAHLSGLNGSSWRTDLEVHNPGSAPIAYTVDMLVRDADNSAPASRSYTLAPGQSVRHLDALASLFGFTGAATLRITPLGGPLMTNARVYDDVPSGSYGQFVEGQGATAAITSGQTARMIHLSQAADRSAGFRTNLGLVSASAVTTTVVADLFRSDATQLGEVTVTLRPYESVQRTEVFREVASDAVADGYIVVKTTTDGGRFFAYASVIDNRSNDPVYMPAR